MGVGNTKITSAGLGTNDVVVRCWLRVVQSRKWEGTKQGLQVHAGTPVGNRSQDIKGTHTHTHTHTHTCTDTPNHCTTRTPANWS